MSRRMIGCAFALGMLVPRAAAAFDCPPAAKSEEARDARARALFEEALALEPGAPKAALARLQCADSLIERPAVVLRMGTLAERLERHDLAIRSYERYLALSGDDAPDREQVQERIVELRRSKAEREASAERAEARESAQSIAGWLLIGLGSAVAIAGGGLLIAAKLHNDDVHALENTGTRWNTPAARETYERAELEQALGIGGVVLGVAVASGGVVLVTFVPSPQTGALVIRGAF